MKRNLLILLLILGAIISSNAQSIKGRVVDQITNNELLGAVVTIKNTGYTAVTDINGVFFIKTNSTECKLIIEYYDYPKIEIVVNKQENQDLNLGLIKLKTSDTKIVLKK